MSGRALLSAIVVAASAGAGAAVGLAAATPEGGAPRPAPSPNSSPSPVVYPAETITLRFDHARHARLGGTGPSHGPVSKAATCEGCHAGALTSTSAGDSLVPGEAACRACHAIDRTQPAKVVPPGQGAARCDACHVSEAGVGWVPPQPLAEPPRTRPARPNVKFNHQLHAARGVGCATCHPGVEARGAATRADLPVMAVCLDCHKREGGRHAAATRCGACHPTEPDGRLKTVLPAAGLPGGTGRLVPSGSLRGLDAHGPTFRRDHAQAGRDEGYCLTCHRRNECMDCHAGVVRPSDIHPSDYVTLHGGDARRNMPDCGSCHRNQTFCVGCHQRSGVAPDPEGGLPGRQPQNPFGTGTQLKRFHPPGWVRDEAGATLAAPTPTSHSLQAKRNIRACASCHREDSCLACHSADPTRSIGVSPHGPGFAATAKCRALSQKNRRACLKCHALASAELDCL